MSEPVSFLDVRQSLKDSRWVFPEVEQDIVARISQLHGLPDFVARMLHIRGVGPDDVESFLYPTLRDHFPDPFSLKGMRDFAEDIAKKIINHELIGVLADFDVDGSTSAAILIRYLRACGMNAPFYIPCRLNEGYGPNVNALMALKNDGALSVIMADCGTTAFDVVAAGRNMGLEISIFDHHEAEGELPQANHVINPKRKDDASGLDMLAACGVTFLSCVAINNVLRREKYFEKNDLVEPNMKGWIDLVALGTVCDMVPMTGPNRLFVRAGFHQMAMKTNMGIRALCEVANLESAPKYSDAGFVLGPRINAGSRVHKSDLGTKLLSTDNLDEARSIAFVLDDCNEQRKSIQSKMMKEAIERVEKEELHLAPVIVVGDPDWHPGLSGLVAGRLKERYGKPAICVTYAENTDGVLEGRGSGRSVAGVNIAEAFIDARNQDILVKGGGHAMAGGFTVMPDRLPEFREFLCSHVEKQSEHIDLSSETVIDGIASIRGAQSQFVRLLNDHVGPFGPQNAEPVFALANVRIQTSDVLKDKHIRVNVADWEGGTRMKAMFFYGVGTKLGDALLNHGQRLLHLAGQFQLNSWQGRESVEFLISDGAIAMETSQKAA
ncbi:MAG: single-stranded-DNA-specific exonuclease RecJ [Micavibrio aeruginosavorus]|uniref:Single-stranded-DNA-specific exonuclease RecJ n=1 Tax=Micavibrio aeruginosavorus TaxID=349221 RepID=A0A2W5N296_9BACT|nr:MAG: single-stranded-DNA-specific exonuclease RecJ [Micavibrio aeruginosavorus]